MKLLQNETLVPTPIVDDEYLEPDKDSKDNQIELSVSVFDLFKEAWGDDGEEDVQLPTPDNEIQTDHEKPLETAAEKLSRLEKNAPEQQKFFSSLFASFANTGFSPHSLFACACHTGALSNLGQSVSSVGQMSQIGGISNIPGMHIHGDNITFSGSVNELSRRTGFSAADIRAGKFSPGEILAALYSSFGEVMTMVFGGGLFGGIFDLILQTFCGGSQDNSASAMAH